MTNWGRAAVLGAIALLASASAAVAEGDGEPAPQGPRESFSYAGSTDGAYGDKGFAAPQSTGQPDDRVEAQAEPQFVDGDPYGRTDYWQDGRGNRRGTQYGPGFYQKGYYYPSERQFPDYTNYDERRAGRDGTLWSVVYRGVIDPFVPDQREIDFARALPVRVVTKLRLDEDFMRLRALAKAQRDSWAGGQYDSPRPLK